MGAFANRDRIYLCIFVELMHALITFFLSDDLASIFHDDLVWLKCPIRPNAMSTINGLADFDTDSVFPTSFGSLTQLFKGTICAMFWSDVAIAIVAFVEHEAVETILIATAFRSTDAFGRL